MTASSLRQVHGLLALRWQMARAPGVRLALCLAGLLAVWLVAVALRIAGSLGPVPLDTATQLAPEAFLGFLVLALVAPLTGGSGADVVPTDQLVAFPVRPGALFLGGLLLAPLNLVWFGQLLLLAAETSCLTFGGRTVPGVLTTAAYVLFATVLGQAMAWTVAGLRATRAGRRGVLAAALAVAVGVGLVVELGLGPTALQHSPTRVVVRAVVAGGAGDGPPWAVVTVALLGLGAVTGWAGRRACAWALARPVDATGAGTGAVRRRGPRRSALRELAAVDRASVWRAPALRRGGLVLALLPGAAAAGVRVPWSSLVVLPGLVAAGTGLLFGVNAFALDGPGALWLASLPVTPDLPVRAKLLVLAEAVLAAVAVTVLAGAVRAPGTPTAAELVAILGSAATCTAVVLATGLHLSVRRPHRADLRTSRDAIAPPGALVVASIRLTAPTTAVGIALGAATVGDHPWLPPLVALPVLWLCAASLRRSLRAWGDPVVRARVVQVVSAG